MVIIICYTRNCKRELYEPTYTLLRSIIDTASMRETEIREGNRIKPENLLKRVNSADSRNLWELPTGACRH